MKKMRLIAGILTVMALVAVIFTSCKKEETKKPLPDANFSFAASGDGRTIQFTNESTDATTYLWEFGDSQTSTEVNPIHTYPDYGTYTVKLTATGEGGVADFSYQLPVTKSSPVKMDDNSHADWATIADAFVSVDNSGGLIQKVKIDYDGNYIYFYMETTETLSDSLYTGIHFDLDNDTTTGFWPWTNTGIGADVYMEGRITTAADIIFFDWDITAATQDSWAWVDKAATDFITYGYTVQDGPTVKTEWAVNKLKLSGTTINGPVNLGNKVTIIINHYYNWEPAGFFPGNGEPAYVLNML
jgi:PKD repeat protein